MYIESSQIPERSQVRSGSWEAAFGGATDEAPLLDSDWALTSDEGLELAPQECAKSVRLTTEGLPNPLAAERAIDLGHQRFAAMTAVASAGAARALEQGYLAIPLTI